MASPVAADLRLNLVEDEERSGQLPSATDADGDAITYVLLQPPATGQVVVLPDGRYVYTPARHFHGTDFFIYEVRDSTGTAGTSFSSTTQVDVVSKDTAA